MEEYRYSSNLAVYMQQFMDEKYARGYESPYLSSELREIDKYLIEHPTGIEITENYYQQWFKTLDDGNRTRKTIYKIASSFCQQAFFLFSSAENEPPYCRGFPFSPIFPFLFPYYIILVSSIRFSIK